MVTTLLENNAYGLAAPQVGYDLRVFVIRVHLDSSKRSYENMEEIPLTVMINPKIKIIEGSKTNLEFEGCVSVPELRGKVRRYTDLFIEYYTPEGIKIQKFVHGYFARLVQHEYDHLDGTIFLEKVESDFALKSMIKQFNLK